MAYVAKESGTNVGSLTVISTHATVDTPDATRQEIIDLIRASEGIGAATRTAA